MSLDKALKNLKYDVRLVEQNIKNNNVTKEEYEKHLAQLPDLSAQIQPIDAQSIESQQMN